jgi:hypothetical protein
VRASRRSVRASDDLCGRPGIRCGWQTTCARGRQLVRAADDLCGSLAWKFGRAARCSTGFGTLLPVGPTECGCPRDQCDRPATGASELMTGGTPAALARCAWLESATALGWHPLVMGSPPYPENTETPHPPTLRGWPSSTQDASAFIRRRAVLRGRLGSLAT